MPVEFMILKDWFETKDDGPKDLSTCYPHLCTKQIILNLCLKVNSCVNFAHALYHAKVITYLLGYNITFSGTMKHSKPYRNLRVRGNRSVQDMNNLCNESPCEDKGLHLHDIVPNKKLEKTPPVCSRLDSFSSCSSDSAFYCSPQCLEGDCMISAQETLSKMVKINDNYITKRTRNSSGSSALSSASDSSNKGLQPLVINGVLKHFIAPTKCMAEKLPEITSTIARVKEVSTAASVMVSSVPTTTKSTVKTIVKEKTVSITCKSVTSSVPEPVTFHNLRKRIRKKRCCDCDCGSNHATVIVRRFTQIQHRTKTRQCSSQRRNKPKILSPRKNILSSACSQNVALPKELRFKNAFSSPKSKVNKRRRSEVDKLYDDLHEIDWAKNFSRDNILSQCVDYRRPAASALYSTSRKVSSTSSTTVKTTLQTFRPIRNDFKEVTKDLRKSIVPDIENLHREQAPIRKPNSITYPLLDNSKSLDTPLSSTVNGTGMFQCTFETTEVTKKIYDSSRCIDTVSVEKTFNGMCANNPDEPMSGITNGDSMSFINHHDFALSLLQSKVANGNVSSSYDSENSSFALDISPSISDDESIQGPELSETSSCHKRNNSNDLPAISKCAMKNSNTTEPRQDISSVSQEICDASLLPVESEVNEEGIIEVATDDVKFIVESVVDKICIFESQSAQSLSVEAMLEDERCNVLSSVSSDYNVESNKCMEKNKSSESNSIDLLIDSFELPVLSITSPVAENSAVEDHPPSLEPYLHYSTEVKSSHYDVMFHNDINEVEIVIPCSNADLIEPDSESSNKDVKNGTEISDFDKQLKNSESLNMSFSERLQHFKSINNGKAFSIRRKILKKYFGQSRSKLKLNQITTSDTFFSPCANINRNSDLLNDSYHDNPPTVPFSNQKSPKNEIFESAFAEDSPVTRFPGNRLQIFTKNRPAKKIGIHDWSVPSTSTDYVKDSFVVDCVETQSSSISKFNEMDRTFNNIHKISSTSMPMTQPVVSLVNCSMYSQAQRNSRFHIKNDLGTNRVQVVDVTSQELQRKVEADVYSHRSGLLETLEKAKKSKTNEDLLVPFGVTFHYKCITVNRYNSFTKVILKLTRGQDIYLSAEALTELKDTVNNAKDDPSCKILILIGTDSCFCCGIDLLPLLEEGKEEAAKEISIAIKKFVEALVAFEKPIVTVVNGKTVGFGVTILTYSDIVLASDAASFTMRYGELGYFPEGAATLMLPRVMGLVKGMDMMLKGLKLTADEAKACNLVTEVLKASRLPYELVNKVKCLERNNLMAMQMTKAMVLLHYYHSLKTCLEKEEQMLPKQWLSESCQKAMQVANEKGLL